MTEGEIYSSTQLIDGQGNFNDAGMEDFYRTSGFSQCGLSYAVVAIIGPQSSGKSTLFNHMFQTNFQEMNALQGRSQTTKGIWIANCKETDPFIVAMDLEGTDGIERSENDSVFEKQSALFVLAVADIVLINMWCHDIGRDHAANRPLLKTVFQVLTRLFSPKKTTLLFVIRDKTKTPLQSLERTLREDIQKIWNEMPKLNEYEGTSLNQFFNVEITALPNFEEKEDQFKEEVAELRERLLRSSGGLISNNRTDIPASGFSSKAKKIWKDIKENKDLNLPALKVMVAKTRCEEVFIEKMELFEKDKKWLETKDALRMGAVSGFGTTSSEILNRYLSEYDADTSLYDEVVRQDKRQQLQRKILKLVCPSYEKLLGHICAKAAQGFKDCYNEKTFASSVEAVNGLKELSIDEFDNECKDAALDVADWNALEIKIRQKLMISLEFHIAEIQLGQKLIASIDLFLGKGGSSLWSSIRMVMNKETEIAVDNITKAFNICELNAETQQLMNNVKNLVHNKMKKEAVEVVKRMVNRFTTVLKCNNTDQDIPTIIKQARSLSLEFLSEMAAVRLSEKEDIIKDILYSSLMGENSDEQMNLDEQWPEVSVEDTVIPPCECKSLWAEFEVKIADVVTEAQKYDKIKQNFMKGLIYVAENGPSYLDAITKTLNSVRELYNLFPSSYKGEITVSQGQVTQLRSSEKRTSQEQVAQFRSSEKRTSQEQDTQLRSSEKRQVTQLKQTSQEQVPQLRKCEKVIYLEQVIEKSSTLLNNPLLPMMLQNTVLMASGEREHLYKQITNFLISVERWKNNK